MNVLWVDTETYSDLDLREVGMPRYVENSELLVVTWAWNHEPVRVWDVQNDPDAPCKVADLRAALEDADVIRAANAPFDRLVLAEHVWSWAIEPARWDCLQVRARRCGWARVALDALCTQLEVPQEQAKLGDGKRLLRLFTRPHKPTKREPVERLTIHERPEEWARFLEYAVLDVEALRACWERLPGPNDTPVERAIWLLDQDVNDRGWPADRQAAMNACELVEDATALINRQLATLTDGVVQKTSAVPAMKRWLLSNYGIQAYSLDAASLRQYIEGNYPAPVRQLATLRREGSRSTNAKYKALLLGLSADDRLRHALTYGGAVRTLRWSGKKFQPHNLIRSPKGYDARDIASVLHQGASLQWFQENTPFKPVLEVLAYGIRGAIMAASGQVLGRGDLSQIEARLVNWLACNERMLAVFADPDQDPYVYTAQQIGSSSRQLGKVLTLACGYGMAGETFLEQANAAPYYLGMRPEEADEAVESWREANPEVVSFWYALNDAAINCVLTGQPRECRRLQLQVWTHAGIDYLGIRLPSGRWLCLPKVRMAKSDWRGHQLEYWGEKGWTRTHGGPLVGICTQSTARDLLAGAMVQAARAGLRVVGHVHDEAIIEMPEDEADAAIDTLHRCLVTPPEWAAGVPLAAECMKTKRFAKL